ncbi:hypothetical protein O7627_24720 [Solwaraspora sp. WMMD1047]|uniref:hypothetical protein n=1 Tax=Solwaraspora sp. WMMD1047 TaxID=3016102 RepID=UPI00241625C9|nr:hypothetical protein [Solwaraspora sp. WMMD1047]MDG4832486.1 hypothetical protein [Solwaraspora sp. WMMD1047]
MRRSEPWAVNTSQSRARVATGPAAGPSGCHVNLERAEPSADDSYRPGRECELFTAAQALTATGG